jgi:hypothetical protein
MKKQARMANHLNQAEWPSKFESLNGRADPASVCPFVRRTCPGVASAETDGGANGVRLMVQKPITLPIAPLHRLKPRGQSGRGEAATPYPLPGIRLARYLDFVGVKR